MLFLPLLLYMQSFSSMEITYATTTTSMTYLIHALKNQITWTSKWVTGTVSLLFKSSAICSPIWRWRVITCPRSCFLPTPTSHRADCPSFPIGPVSIYWNGRLKCHIVWEFCLSTSYSLTVCVGGQCQQLHLTSNPSNTEHLCEPSNFKYSFSWYKMVWW